MRHKGQIFAMEVFTAMARELGLPDIRPEWTRRNVFTWGTDLNALTGVESDERVEAWLKGRGGLRARILTDSVLTCDDLASFSHDEAREGRVT